MIFNECSWNRSCIVANGREKRPFIGEEKKQCPFCKENKWMIEKVWLAYQDDKNLDIDIRVVNNKYPVCNQSEELYGIHDVVIDTPRHNANPKDYSKEHWKAILIILQERWKMIKQDERIRFIQVFKNFGERAGASINHSHWQIISLEEPPITMNREYEKSSRQCIVCEWLKQLNKENIIYENEEWFIIAPNTPQMIYETWVVPKKHISNYEQVNSEMIESLSGIFQKIIGAYNQLNPEVHYNICWMSEKINIENQYHFYIKIIPREGNFGGYELATGCSITTISPRDYGEILKKQIEEIENNFFK
ncbi:MAG: galactose-1-phosphate uridylyltransferase [Cellulosilyticaceae bacterium]